MRELSFEGKNITFKSLDVSKIIHLGLIFSLLTVIIKQLNLIKKIYLARKKKTTNKTLYFQMFLPITWSYGYWYILLIAQSIYDHHLKKAIKFFILINWIAESYIIYKPWKAIKNLVLTPNTILFLHGKFYLEEDILVAA